MRVEIDSIRRYYFPPTAHSLNREEAGGHAVKKQTLNYRFHNPNTAEATADYIVKILLEANRGKAERAIQTAGQPPQQEEAAQTV